MKIQIRLLAEYKLRQGSFRGDLKVFFLHRKIFSAQLVPAQRLSAMIQLRKFCPVATLNFKCLAWHICPGFLCDKNWYYERARILILIF